MEYAQLNTDLTDGLQVATHGNVEWDPTHFCPASALTSEEADLFRVVPLTVTEPPAIDPLTQRVYRDGCEFIGGAWQYKWAVEVLSAPTIAANLAAARAAIHASIKAERDRRKFNGVYVSNKWIHTDTYSRTQWMGMVMMGASVPTVQWTTLDNTTIATSQALANAVFQATATLDATLFAHAKSLIAAVDASNDPASVDIAAGWPVTFEGA